MGILESAIGVAVLAGAVVGRVAPRMVARLRLGHGAFAVVAVAAGIVLAGTLIDLPFGAWRLRYERRWGFSRTSTAQWASDQIQELILSVVLGIAAALAFAGVTRLAHWWLVAWVGGALLLALLVMVAPAVISPLFNHFRPLHDPELRARTQELADRAGVEIRSVLVMDASRRTAKHNAYFTGLGRTKRVVLWDTLLADYEPAATLVVLAHELGHWRRRHVLRLLGLAAVGLGPALFVLDRLLSAAGAQRALGVSGATDPAALVVAVAVAVVLQAAALPALGWCSRAWERQADLDSLELTGDADAFAALQRDLALRNLSDLAPSRWAYLLASHPPPPERLALAGRHLRSA